MEAGVGGINGLSVTGTSEFFTGSTGTVKLFDKNNASNLENLSDHLLSKDCNSD